MVKRATKKQRGQVNRDRRKLILIGCEGKNQTEKNYFLNFNKIQSEYRIIEAKGIKSDPKGVLNDLCKSMEKEELVIDEGDIPACFIDVDFSASRKTVLRSVLKVAKEKNIQVYLSNPCFEIWYLLHFRYSTKQYNSNEEVINDLKKYLNSYKKNQIVFDTLLPLVSTAITNAKKLISYHSGGKNDCINQSPSTDVYQLVELLLQYSV